MGDILLNALTLVLIIATGNTIKRLGWVRAEHFPLFSTIVLRITLPAAVATSFNQVTITPDLLFLAVIAIAINLAHQCAGYVLAWRGTRQDKAFAVLNTGGFNIGAFATPYISTLMGPSAVVYTSIFDVGNSVSAAGFGYGWGLSLAREDVRTTPLGFLRQMFSSSIFVTYLILVTMRLLDLRLPDQVIVFTSTVGAANTFLAMLMIGIGLEIQLPRHKIRLAAKFLAARYTISALAAVAVWNLLPVDAEIRTVLCLLFFAPMAAMTSGFTSEAGGDVELSTFMTTATVLVGIVAMPAILLALGG